MAEVIEISEYSIEKRKVKLLDDFMKELDLIRDHTKDLDLYEIRVLTALQAATNIYKCMVEKNKDTQND